MSYGFTYSVQTITSGGTTSIDLTSSLVRIHRSSDAAVTIQLPTLSSINTEGAAATIYLTDGFASKVTILPASGDTIATDLPSVTLFAHRALTFVALTSTAPTWGIVPVS